MTLRRLAKTAGVSILRCGPEWGGTFAYAVKGQGAIICGYRSRHDALKGWLSSELSSKTARLLLAMLKRGERIVMGAPKNV